MPPLLSVADGAGERRLGLYAGELNRELSLQITELGPGFELTDLLAQECHF